MSNITEEPPSTDLITLTRWVHKETPPDRTLTRALAMS